VLVDGVSAGAVAGIAFTNITANHTIFASFATLPTAELQTMLDLAVSDAGIPGAIMAVQTPTETWIGTAGKADLGDATQSRDPQAMTADTQVHLAGVTRLFTAALIMKLVEENKIKLDDTVDQWLFPDAVPSADQITLRMLLNHTSGLHDHETTQEFFSGLISFPTLAWDPFVDILPIMELSTSPDFKPGTDFKYSSSDYFLLGLAAESTTMFTDTVENLIKTEFFDPLNLSHTSLPASGLFDQTNPFARSYYWAGVPQFPTLTDSTDWDLSFDWTNGSGVSTAQDILNFTTALFAGKVVNSQSLQQMTTPQQLTSAQGTLPYGFGLEVANSDQWFGEKMYQSDGETVGAYARWLYYPDSGRTIFIAFNRGDKRFNTDPPLNPAPDPPQVDASQKADDLLKAASNLIKASQ
nr:serine hydrolase [Chloroflexota bacterium]